MTPNDINTAIQQLRVKLTRQEHAVEATKAMIETLTQILKTTK